MIKNMMQLSTFEEYGKYYYIFPVTVRLEVLPDACWKDQSQH
jgi:hypothetical protein